MHLRCLMGHDHDVGGHVRELLALAMEIGDDAYRARALWHLSKIQSEIGDTVGARKYGEQSLAMARQAGDTRETINALAGLAFISEACGTYEQAECHWEEALVLSRRMSNRFSEAIASLHLVQTAISSRQADRATWRFVQAREAIAGADSRQLDQYLVEIAATLAALTGESAMAVKLNAACAEQRFKLGMAPNTLGVEQARDLARARAVLGETACAAAEQAGRTMHYSQALAEAGAWLDRTAQRR